MYLSIYSDIYISISQLFHLSIFQRREHFMRNRTQISLHHKFPPTLRLSLHLLHGFLDAQNPYKSHPFPHSPTHSQD